MIASLGRYRIVQQLPTRFGRSLWLADDATLGRRVRLEVVPIEGPQAEVHRARFAREARVASQVHHGCIATVYDAGTADGYHYIARQLLEGTSLRDRIARQEPIVAAVLMQVAADIASALQCLHELGLVHGEVDADAIHVLDDGHAILDGLGLASTGRTPEGDLHGFGVVLSSMRSRTTVMSPDLERLIKDLQTRPITAAQLTEELRRMQGASQADESTIAVVIPTGRTGRGIRTKIVVGAVLLVALGASVMYVLARPKPTIPSVAMLPLVEARPDSSGVDPLMDGIGESVVTKLSQVTGVRVSPWMTVQRYAVTDRPLPELARELGVEQLVVGSFAGTGDSVRVVVRLVDGATGAERWRTKYSGLRTDVLELQRDLALDVARELRVRLTAEQRRLLRRPASASTEAWELYLRGSAEMQTEERPSYQRARLFFDQALVLDPDLPEAYVGIGAVWTASNFNSWEPTESALLEAERNFQRALALNPTLPTALRGMIRVHYHRGQDEKCLIVGQEVTRSYDENVETLLIRGDAYYFGSLYEDAVVMYRRVLALDPVNAAALEFLAASLDRCGRPEETIVAGEEYIKRFGFSGTVLSWLSNAYGCTGNVERRREINEHLGWGGKDQSILSPGELNQEMAANEAMLMGPYEQPPANIFALEYLGVIEAKRGNRNAAMNFELMLARIENGCTPAFRAVIREALGDADGAVEMRREAIRRGNLMNCGLRGPCSPIDTTSAKVRPKNYRLIIAEFLQVESRFRAQYGLDATEFARSEPEPR